MDLRCIICERMDKLSGAPHGRVPLTEQFLTTSRIIRFQEGISSIVIVTTFQKTKFRFVLWNVSQWSATDLIVGTINRFLGSEVQKYKPIRRLVTSIHYIQKIVSVWQLYNVGLLQTVRLLIFNRNRVSFPGLPRLGHEYDHSFVVRVEVKSEWSCISTPHICLNVVDRNNITLSTTHNYYTWTRTLKPATYFH
jgi:hypothetical protein